MTTALLTDSVTADPARAVRLTLLWGLDAVVLRTVGGARVPDVAEGPLRRRLEENELPVAGLDPGLFEGSASARAGWLDDLARLDDLAPFARRVGAGLVRVGALAADDTTDGAAGALRQAGERAAALGLKLAVRNDVESVIATGAALAALLAEADHPALAADWRPADALVSGEDPEAGLRALTDADVFIACVGVRDGKTDGDWTETVVGEGAVGWGRQLSALAAAGFDGPLVLEAVPQPVRSAGLSSATALIRMTRAAAR